MRDGEIVPLGLKAFEILMALIRNQGQVLMKDELMTQVWPDTHVEESNLTRTISALRKALGESSNEHPYIATIPGRGYRFVASVREIEPSGEESAQAKAGEWESGRARDKENFSPLSHSPALLLSRSLAPSLFSSRVSSPRLRF